jgi:hypothetical protein
VLPIDVIQMTSSIQNIGASEPTADRIMTAELDTGTAPDVMPANRMAWATLHLSNFIQ